MQLTDDDNESLRQPLPCFWLNPAGNPTQAQRTVLMTGMARSGTSFIGSVIGRLGVVCRRNAQDKVSGHWEHVDLRDAFKTTDAAEFERIISEFNQVSDIWAWKLPSLRTNFDWVISRIRNPCFIISFKEPLSMAMRKISTGHADNLERHFRKIFREYQELIEFACSTDHPVLLVSYDKALRNMDECIAALAKFSGVESYDAATVKMGVEEDARRY